MLSYTNNITDLNKSLRIDERTIHQFILKDFIKRHNPILIIVLACDNSNRIHFFDLCNQDLD